MHLASHYNHFAKKKKEAGPMDLFTRLEAEPNYGSARYRGGK